MPTAKPLSDRLWGNVTKTDTCWLWTGYIERGGYGQIRTPKGKCKVHRVAYELLVGPIPAGLLLDHLCQVRHCVNPGHLRVVTPKQNAEHLSSRRDRFGIQGVTFDRAKGKYRARVRHDYLLIHVGYFVTPEEADRAVKAKRNELFTHNDKDRQ